jgi:ubiquinone biosynthesis protein UbiJ
MFNNLMHKQLLTGTLETIINKVLSLDGQLCPALDALENKTLCLVLNELNFPLSFTITHHQVTVTGLTIKSDCFLQTSLKHLPEIKNAEALTQLIKSDLLIMEGDLKIAQQFANLAEQLDIDWQEQLALRIGDVATHKLSQLGQFISGKLNFAKTQIESDASEYLLHEQQLACGSAELDVFCHGVSQAEQACSALDKRLASLELALVKMKEKE